MHQNFLYLCCREHPNAPNLMLLHSFFLFYFAVSVFIFIFAARNQIFEVMATVATNKLWAYIESLSLSRRDRNWLAGKLLEPTHDADPYEISPSGDPFFADSRNVKAVKDDISKAHSPQAEFTRLESKEDIMSMINAL